MFKKRLPFQRNRVRPSSTARGFRRTNSLRPPVTNTGASRFNDPVSDALRQSVKPNEGYGSKINKKKMTGGPANSPLRTGLPKKRY